VTVAIPSLVLGLWFVVFPVLDMLPFPGSGQNGFFEWWIPGIPLTWLGLRALRAGLRPQGGRVA
jgi:hypothetical protein